MRRTILASAATIAVLLLATSAHAGPEFDLRVAYGSAGKQSPTHYEQPAGYVVKGENDDIYGFPQQNASPYGGGLITQLSIGFRFIPFLSAGFSGGYRKSSAEAPDDTYKGLSRSAFEVGPYLRAYIPLVPFIDPWIGLGVEYMNDTQKYQRADGIDRTLTHHGIALPLTIGIDYVAIPALKIGPSFQYTTVFPAGGCWKASIPGVASNSQCTDGNPQLTHAKGYSVWSIGLNVRLSL